MTEQYIQMLESMKRWDVKILWQRINVLLTLNEHIIMDCIKQIVGRIDDKTSAY